jgi:hypothetical protein
MKHSHWSLRRKFQPHNTSLLSLIGIVQHNQNVTKRGKPQPPEGKITELLLPVLCQACLGGFVVTASAVRKSLKRLLQTRQFKIDKTLDMSINCVHVIHKCCQDFSSFGSQTFSPLHILSFPTCYLNPADNRLRIVVDDLELKQETRVWIRSFWVIEVL